ncbi:MAG: ADP-glyceromanno-heptose 6-epimerase [Saprospiraceae bacterium]|nr:ADP-glyceromanno-heptose 6-epimerase [Saprospiraceae bacterium]MDG2418858.1 ADP-glyceromanno-heptose 6-epimerase [Saprospiraceae bacterium]
MIVVTGAAGFIGSCLVQKLNEEGHTKNIVVVDDFYKDYKDKNLDDKWIRDWIHRDLFLDWFGRSHQRVGFVFHIGARTDTAEQNKEIFDELNLNYSKRIWEICTEKQIPLVYASSAATYGGGEYGYEDSHEIVSKLKPLNPYGDSKNDFDKWVLEQKNTPPFWVGTKFFNVYGPNEYHKKRMASVIFHAYNQIIETNKMMLFRSHKENIKNGHQKRDFIYVKDVVNILCFFYKEQKKGGLYNIGTGKARTFLDLVNATFKAMNIEPDIGFIDTPKDIRDNYQYFTEANMKKLRAAGYEKKFYSLEEGVQDYVKNYLQEKKIY